MDTSHSNSKQTRTTKRIGDAAEDEALHYLQAQGLQLVQRNYRTPGRGGGEIDVAGDQRRQPGVSNSPVRRAGRF